jgi:hypothetical protein
MTLARSALNELWARDWAAGVDPRPEWSLTRREPATEEVPGSRPARREAVDPPPVWTAEQMRGAR